MKIFIRKKKLRTRNKLALVICMHGLLGFHSVYATTYFVSTSGNDMNNGTSLSTPVKTINKGLSKAQTSGDIVYVMTGIYNETVDIVQSGITLSAYPNNSPIVDGGGSLPSQDWGTLISVDGNYNTLSGFEVKNSNINGSYQGGYGVQIAGHHNVISNMNTHHTWGNGILINGDYNTVQDSKVWQTSRLNAANPGSGGWGSGLTAARNERPEALIHGISSFAVIRRNIVYNNWGEGLSCYEADHCTIEDNIVYDNWALNIYLSDATYSLVQRNLVYISSSPAIFFPITEGITLADEIPSAPRSAYNTIINNFIYNADLNAFKWTLVAGSGLNNVLIAYNTIVGGNLSTGDGQAPARVHINSQLRNNIVTGSNSSVPENNGLTFSNNNWAVTPKLAASITDVNADPQIAKTGATTPGALTSAYFKTSLTSPTIASAIYISSVLDDFFQCPRGSTPDIGGQQHNPSCQP